MNLRPYQQSALESITGGFREFQRQLAVLPTGSGKTILFSHLAKHLAGMGGRTLILAHREELIDQAIDKLHQATGIVAAKEMADWKAHREARVVVASVQSMQGERLKSWPRNHFDLVICDEAHHSISDSWQAVLSHFGSANVLGVTATPDRGDKRNLGEFYQNIAAEVDLFDLIRDGYLSNIKAKSIPLEIDVSGVKSTAGDLDSKGLGDALTPYLGSIAKAIAEHAADRKVLAFLPLIDTSKRFVDACQFQGGLRACHVYGKSKNRAEILQAFADDKYDVLSNAMLLTEGYDCPDVDCVVVLRPTRSRPLYSQMIGRGTRTAPFKEDLLLLDFLWHHERHNLIHPAHLVAESQDQAAMMTKALERVGRESQDELDLEGLASEAAVEREQKLADELAANTKRKASEKDMMEFCLAVHRADVAQYEPTMGWESDAITPKQAEILKRNGINPDGVRGKGHASQLLDVVFE
jgi:superfamily II DNA or RNA helicase